MRGYFENQVLMQAEAPLEDILRTLIDDPLSLQRSVLVLKDVPLFKDQMTVIELLKYLARRISNGSLPDFNIVIVSSEVCIPGELDPFLTILHDEYLTVSDIRGVIEQFCRDQEVDMLPEFIRELAQMFKGLSEYEINTILALALSDDGEITRSDLSLILEQKKQVVQKSGILEMIPLKEGMDDIGGLESLKQWLQRKEKIFRNMEAAAAFGVDMPKASSLPACPDAANPSMPRRRPSFSAFPCCASIWAASWANTSVNRKPICARPSAWPKPLRHVFSGSMNWKKPLPASVAVAARQT